MYGAYHIQHIVLSLKERAISLNTLYMPLKMDNHICETPSLMGLNRIEYFKTRHIKVSMPLKKSDLFSDLLVLNLLACPHPTCQAPINKRYAKSVCWAMKFNRMHSENKSDFFNDAPRS